MNWFKRVFSSRKEEIVNVTPIVDTDKVVSTTSATYHLQQGRYELQMVAQDLASKRARLAEQIKEMDIEFNRIQDMLMYSPPVKATLEPIAEAPQLNIED